jgi:DNA-directed RNA polymerase specialized sigma subunit
MEALVELVKAGLTNATDIAKEMGLSKGQISKLAKKAIAEGRLVKLGRGYATP